MKKNILEKLFWYSGWFYDFTKYATLVVVFCVIVHYFFVSVLVIRGASMYPNYQDGYLMLVNKISYFTDDPERGDVVGMFFPGETDKRFIKRVIGLPGETIRISQGRVYINNQLLEENYLDSTIFTSPSLERTLQAGEYFVMGDNRNESSDSRAWGPVPRSFIVGKATERIISVL